MNDRVNDSGRQRSTMRSTVDGTTSAYWERAKDPLRSAMQAAATAPVVVRTAMQLYERCAHERVHYNAVHVAMSRPSLRETLHVNMNALNEACHLLHDWRVLMIEHAANGARTPDHYVLQPADTWLLPTSLPASSDAAGNDSHMTGPSPVMHNPRIQAASDGVTVDAAGNEVDAAGNALPTSSDPRAYTRPPQARGELYISLQGEDPELPSRPSPSVSPSPSPTKSDTDHDLSVASVSGVRTREVGVARLVERTEEVDEHHPSHPKHRFTPFLLRWFTWLEYLTKRDTPRAGERYPDSVYVALVEMAGVCLGLPDAPGARVAIKKMVLEPLPDRDHRGMLPMAEHLAILAAGKTDPNDKLAYLRKAVRAREEREREGWKRYDQSAPATTASTLERLRAVTPMAPDLIDNSKLKPRIKLPAHHPLNHPAADSDQTS